MPFKSKKQQRWMFLHDPEMAKEWASKTDFKKLPEKTKKKKNKKKASEDAFETIEKMSELFYSLTK